MDASSSVASTSTSADASTSASSSSSTTSNKAAASTSTAPEQHTNGQTGANGAPIACNGCHQSLEETSDTVVVSFGEGLWHVDCFRCAKCNNLVEHDTNLLLLADGSPVCEGCSYVCSYCNQSISNEAIVTGDESYHADCFRCKACSTRIEELVFAKTSQGIYCMACHNERVARTRKHAESKRNRSLRRNQRQGSSGQGSSGRSRHGASSSTSVNAEHNSKTFTPQPYDSSIRHENGHLAANDNSTSNALHSPLTDSESTPNSASLATASHLQAAIRRGSADADASISLPEPPASLKKLRGMDKSPRIGDKETLHPKGQDHTNMHTSPRRGQEALYMSPSANSGKALPVIDGIAERSDSNSSIDRHARQMEPSEAISSKPSAPALNIPRSPSPSPSARTASPVMPASSPTNLHFTQLHRGLTAPRANASRNPNRRSGFYGAMAMPAGGTSPTGSGSVTPVLQEEEQAENGYFGKPDGNDAEQDANSSQEDLSAGDKALPVRPLAINRNQGQTDRNGISGTPSSSLSSVNTSGAGSTSSLSIPSTSSHTPHTLSASSSAGKNNHLSFYDPDVLVFLDAVNDGPGTQRRAPTSSLSADRHEQDASSLSTPTKEHDEARHSGRSLSSTAAQDGYNSDSTPDTTLRDHADLSDLQIRSRSLSPNPEQRYSLTPSPRQPRDLNLVANGHISTFSASTTEGDEEREMLSPLNSRRQSSGANGLGLSTAGSQRSNKSNFGAFDDEEEEDDATKTALKRVRESIRQSRGASMSSAVGESPSGIGSGMTLDIELVELLIKELEETKNRMKELQKNYNAIRRASRQAFEGFSMAREEYDREVQARREAEFEMLKLKKELQEQASKLSALNQAQAQQEQLQRQSRDLRSSVVDIEQELRKMKIQRELTYAEMEELAANAKSGPDIADLPDRLSVALDNRLSSLKETYRQELEALSEERDTLQEEVEELRQARDLFTDEGNELNKRNAELSDDLSDARKQLEAVKAATITAQNQLTAVKEQAGLLQKHLHSPNPASPATKQRTKALPPPSRSDSVPQQKALSNLSSSVPSSSNTLRPGPTPGPITRSETPPHVMAPVEAQSATIVQKIDHVAPHATVRKFKWGSKKGLERPLNASISKHPAASQRSMALELSARQHNFQPISILRPVRCESCGDKMWGMGEQRCQACGIYCHSKCAPTFNIICNSAVVVEEPDNRPGAMSIFGNDLVAQCLTENRLVPTVVVKCIEVVESTAIQYEGIYRKSGGMGQTKLISSCFDRGEPFDLGDQDRFNDISAVTSVLKNYFRNLPNPLYTFEFHQDFCSLPSIKESDLRLAKLEDLLHSLPEQHYATLKMLMLHLNRIHRASSENKMTPANLGVVFGPTLLRSPDPSQEFSQMHLKARVVELTVENAPQLFEES